MDGWLEMVLGTYCTVVTMLSGNYLRKEFILSLYRRECGWKGTNGFGLGFCDGVSE